MKSHRIVLNILAITAMTIFTSATVMAHSNRDHSKVPFKWELSEKLNSKIERDLNSSNPSGFVGLSLTEQKKFDNYVINVGNKFEARVRNVDVIFERTSGGLKIVDASKAKKETENVVPIRNISSISKVSTQGLSHIGHNHKRLPVEWKFGPATNSKIVKRMFETRGNIFVGLNPIEQDMLNDYKVKVGNRFQLSISGHSFLVERASGGLKVINHATSLDVVQLNKETNDDNI
ncbi:MAG: hypothetical protein F3739_07840 [Nitrospinae bacterium]|nr:hypothetical protein [Nitrospinota bacterium]MZH46917.1 hypothetical protein [Nitrospinota bacterium]